MTRNLLNVFVVVCMTACSLWSQNTVGLLSYQPDKSFQGFNLFYPHNQPTVYLINDCGELVHAWEDDADLRPGNTAYLREDGRLVKTKRSAMVVNDPIWAGGGGGIVEIRDWNNNLEWSFELNNSLARLHHDIALMPSGNILMIVWELKTSEEAIQAGRDPAKLPENELWPDYIIEVNPETDEIVWEWHVWDHLIQDFDETKDNYGVVGDHPELVDVNWDTSDGAADWLHTNAIDYNAELDQIVICVPTFHEIWVIDHTTTTEQAAGHTGGLGGRGGDLLYRWGNPAVYDAGTEADQQLFYPHDIHWIDADEFVDPSFPYYGAMAVFNNQVGENYSTANIFRPNFDMYSWNYPLIGGSAWEPVDFELIITHPVDPALMYSTGLSSIQPLPNGNFLICVGRSGYSFEITPDEEIVWEYKTPLLGGNPVSQGDTLQINNNLTFRLNRIPADYPAFWGRDLSSKGFIELNPDTTFCESVVSSIEDIPVYGLSIYPNPATDQIAIEWEMGMKVQIEVMDVVGRRIEKRTVSGGREYLDISNWEEGIYFVQINRSETRKLIIAR